MISDFIAVNPDQHKTDMIGAAMAMRAALKYKFKNHGMLQMCKSCRENCPQYRAPGLTFFQCKRGTWKRCQTQSR
jgi:hypothetical protein